MIAYSRLVEGPRELLWAQHQGMKVPGYILAALHDAIELSKAREDRRRAG